MDLALIVTTLGRVERLEHLLASLAGRMLPTDRLVIVAQKNVPAVQELAACFVAGGLPVHVVTSELGASRGRNAGVAALPPGDPLLVFPNDTTWFPPGSLEALRALPHDFRAGAAGVFDENGPKFRLPPAGAPLDMMNVWRVLEVGLLVRRRLFDAVGGFDPDLGTGAPSPWQAGEATDLLLKLRATGHAAEFTWMPSVALGGVRDAHGLSGAERRRKLRRYGRGLGRLGARWRYPLWWRAAFLAAGLVFGLRHPREAAPLDGWWVFLGRLEGLCGRVVGGGALRAVER